MTLRNGSVAITQTGNDTEMSLRLHMADQWDIQGAKQLATRNNKRIDVKGNLTLLDANIEANGRKGGNTATGVSGSLFYVSAGANLTMGEVSNETAVIENGATPDTTNGCYITVPHSLVAIYAIAAASTTDTTGSISLYNTTVKKFGAWGGINSYKMDFRAWNCTIEGIIIGPSSELDIRGCRIQNTEYAFSVASGIILDSTFLNVDVIFWTNASEDRVYNGLSASETGSYLVSFARNPKAVITFDNCIFDKWNVKNASSRASVNSRYIYHFSTSDSRTGTGAQGVRIQLKRADVVIMDAKTAPDGTIPAFAVPFGAAYQSNGTFTDLNNYLVTYSAYEYKIVVQSFAATPSLKDQSFVKFLVADESISETDMSVVEAYPVTLNLTDETLHITGHHNTLQKLTSNQLYDLAKAYLVENYAGESETIVARVGELIDARDLDVSLDYISFDGSITTTGTVTMTNGSTVSGGIIDANGDSFLTFEGVDNWTVFGSEADRQTLTNSLGIGPGIFRFNFSANTAYFLRLEVSGDLILKNITPISAGEMVVSLSTAGLLGSISSTVRKLTAPVEQAAEFSKISAQNTQN